MLSEAGIPSRAWINYPGRVWVESANEGAIYAPDGSHIALRPRNDLAACPGGATAATSEVSSSRPVFAGGTTRRLIVPFCRNRGQVDQHAVWTLVIVPSSRYRTTGHSPISVLVSAGRPFRISFTSLVISRHVSHST